MSNETILIVLGIMGFALEAFVMVGGAVWAVSRIKAAGASLEVTIQHHSELIRKLEAGIDAIVDKASDHGERIVRLEEKIKQ